MKWYTRSCERPRNRSASEALPSSVSNVYFLSIRTHGSSCRCRASSSLRRVSSFSAFSSSSRALSHSSRVPVLCFAIALLPFLCALLPQVGVGLFQPVLARRTEDVDIEGILQRVGLVGQVARQMQHLSRAHHDLFALVPDEELQGTFQDVGELLVRVRVLGDDAALFQ